MKLGIRLSLLLLVSAVLLVGAIISGLITLQAMAGEAEAVVGRDAIYLHDLVLLRARITDAARLARLASEGGVESDDARRARDGAAETLSGLAPLLLDEERDSFRQLNAAWDATASSLAILEAKPAGAAAFFEEVILPRLATVGQTIQDLERFRQAFSIGRIERIHGAIETAEASLKVYGLLLLGVVLALFHEIRYRLIRPIRTLERATEIIASGNRAHRVSGMNADELGELGERFNAMSEKLQDAEKMKGEFLAMVSHEMRTPLTSIGGFLSILIAGRRGPLAPRQREAMEIAYQETQRLGNLIEDLLDVARAESGSFRLAPEPMRCEPFFTALVRPYERQAEELKIRFAHDFEQLPDAVLDARRMGQAIRNLLTNAFKFTPREGNVRVSGARDGDRLVFEVEDTGPGIAADQLPRLFDRFYQVSPGNCGEGGVGLGLAIVREIARAHGGDVSVESTEGRGTLFRIIIPYKVVEPPPREDRPREAEREQEKVGSS